MTQSSGHPECPHTAQPLVPGEAPHSSASMLVSVRTGVWAGSGRGPSGTGLCFPLSNPTDVHTRSLLAKLTAPVLSVEARTRQDGSQDQVLV